MTYMTLLVDKQDQVTAITLSRPKAKNAMSPQSRFDLCAALGEVDADADCRVLVLAEALAFETSKWNELDASEKKTWHKGVKQFMEERSCRPGFESYQWKK